MKKHNYPRSNNSDGSVFALFLLMGACVAAIGGAGSSGPNTTPVAQSANGTASEQQKVAKIGDAVNAGDLTYKIISVEFKKSISDGLGQVYKPGAGQYLVLDVQVTNNGKEKITMDLPNLKISKVQNMKPIRKLTRGLIDIAGCTDNVARQALKIIEEVTEQKTG